MKRKPVRESIRSYLFLFFFLSHSKNLPYLFSHNMTCPQTPLNFNAVKFANRRLQRFIKHAAKGAIFWSTIHFRDSFLKYFSWCRLDFIYSSASFWKKFSLDSISRSDASVTTEFRAWKHVNRCIFNVIIFQRKNCKQFSEPNYFFAEGRRRQILKTNTAGNLIKK